MAATRIMTVHVTGSETMERPDARVAIRLDTRELGSIAFEVDQRAIDALRKQLAAAEQFLQRSGTA
jgi:hypothetical protein